MNSPATMTAIAIDRPGGPEVLVPVTVPVPEPGPGEVLIRVAAAGVNYPDLLQRRGHYAVPPDASPLPGLEVAGTIVGLGVDVSTWQLGDDIVALTHGGGYAEFVAVPEGQILPLPDNWSMVAAAALPETFFTVEQTLVLRAGLAPGMTLLVHGAAGGIGGAAIQIGKVMGATPIAIVSDAAKATYATSLGAAEIIIHTETDFVARIAELTDGAGVDRIVSIAGGDMLMRNLTALKSGGSIVQLAGLSGSTAELDLGLLLRRNATLIGSVLRPQSRSVKAAIANGLRRDVWPHFARGAIMIPRIVALPLAAAAEAHRRAEQRQSFGKYVLVTTWGESQSSDIPIARD